MKNNIKIILLFSIITLFINLTFAQLPSRGTKNTIYNQDITKAIETTDIDNPIRDGTFSIINNKNTRQNGEDPQKVRGIIDVGEISQHQEAQKNVLNIVKNIINYALGSLGLVALIYLLVHGFMIVTAAGDDEKYKKGIKGIKTATIAITGIGLSFFIIAMIFRLVEYISNQ